jgi:hypothetical protein
MSIGSGRWPMLAVATFPDDRRGSRGRRAWVAVAHEDGSSLLTVESPTATSLKGEVLWLHM